MSDLMNKNAALPYDGDIKKGKKATLAVCILEIIGELLMIVNFLVFTRDLSFHKYITFPLELSLLIILAAVIAVLDVITVRGNRVSRVLGAAAIACTFFYNVMDFFLGLALMGAENRAENIPAFVSLTLVCVIKYVCVKNIFTNRHIKAYFYEVNKTKCGL